MSGFGSSLWREVSREVQTTMGRRRGSTSQQPARFVRPAGVQGLVVRESEDSSDWDVVERQQPPANSRHAVSAH